MKFKYVYKMNFIKSIFIIFILFVFISPVNASKTTDSYDGNIFPIYAGNGSIVPPQTSLKESIENERISILFFYLDDSADSKAVVPIISGLDLIWKNTIDIIAITTDELQGKEFNNKTEEGYYWNGYIPQTVLIDEKGNKKYDKNGIFDIDEVNKIIGDIKGIDIEDNSFTVESFNEYNSIISKKNKTNTN